MRAAKLNVSRGGSGAADGSRNAQERLGTRVSALLRRPWWVTAFSPGWDEWEAVPVRAVPPRVWWRADTARRFSGRVVSAGLPGPEW